MYQVIMESAEYGREFFDYESLPEALAGLVRLVEGIESKHADGVQRTVGLLIPPNLEDEGDEGEET